MVHDRSDKFILDGFPVPYIPDPVEEHESPHDVVMSDSAATYSGDNPVTAVVPQRAASGPSRLAGEGMVTNQEQSVMLHRAVSMPSPISVQPAADPSDVSPVTNSGDDSASLRAQLVEKDREIQYLRAEVAGLLYEYTEYAAKVAQRMAQRVDFNKRG